MRKIIGCLACVAVAAAGAAGQEAKQAVPVTRVVLFSSGVGYFEHTGSITGTATTELPFKTEQINDVLKSLVVMDLGGGRISTVSYPNKDPLARVLRSFEVDITANPSLEELLNQLRGAAVRLWTPSEVTGKVLGVETRRRDLPDGQGVVEEAILNVLTDGGTIQAVGLQSVQKILLADERLAAELNKALAALASGRDRGKKPVVLELAGEGQRKVVIGYVVETPIWKTSYRLVLDEKAKPRLQGWAVVENTTDADWTNVQLSLVSGRPISFIQDLYTPLYVPRPVVQPELFASLVPRVYEEDLDMVDVRGMKEELARGEGRGRDLDRARRAAAASPTPALRAAAPGVALGYTAEAAAQAIQSMAAAKSVGELFSYDIAVPVTLVRQRSAMLPIANAEVAGEKVSIYNQSVQTEHPLNGFKLKNTTGLNLLAGPITVFDGGAYAGDARIDNLPPDDERLLSYAVDLEVTVDATKTASTSELLSVQLSSGVLVARRKSVTSRTYVVKNKSKKDKVVLVEHPISSGHTLVKPEKADEKTASLYRFRVKVAAGKTESLEVVEERPYAESVSLRTASASQLDAWVRGGQISDAIKAALQKAIALKQEVAALEKQIAEREQRKTAITQEQVRIRANMQAVAQNSQFYNRLLAKLDEQETELEKLDGEIKELKGQLDEKQKALDAHLLSLSAK